MRCWRTLSLVLVITSSLAASRALAGPVELLDGVNLSPSDPKLMLLRYRNAGGGIMVSHDGGKSFAFRCNSAIDPSVQREASAAIVTASGALLIGVFDGLWRGDDNACGFAKASGLAGLWVNDFARDPHDATRTYLITSSGGKQNGIYVNDGKSDAWTAVGTREDILINRLHVVSTGAKTVRFYESAVRGTYTVAAADGGMGDELPKYVIRYSDDLGKTWTEHEFGMTDGAVRLLAVDPTDGNRIVVGVLRDQTNAEGVSLPDDILYSDTAGKPGSFETIGQVTELGGASFAPDGRFFYGDREQTTPALYAVKKLGDAPKKLQSKDKIQCVNYDAPSDTLYVCKDRELCTADPSTGALTMLFDVTKEDAFVSCDGETAVFDRCQQQLASGWCGITHYPTTPICADYHIPGWDSGVPGGDAGVGSGGSAGGGDKGGAGSDADGGKKSDGKKSSGGCSSAGGSSRASGVGLGAWLALFAVALLQRRRRATRAAR